MSASVLTLIARRKFKFHFSGDRPTNRLDKVNIMLIHSKPHWMIKFVLEQINDLKSMIEEWPEPIDVSLNQLMVLLSLY
jgi:hypothetical protein